MNGQKRCGTHMMEYYSATEKNEKWHLKPGWT